MNMTTNALRNGNFTSSEIVALTTTGKQQLGFGTAAITYIMETNIERMIGRSIDCETEARPLAWGDLMEGYVFDKKLTTNYSLSSTITDIHPEIDYWVGSKDGINHEGEKAVIDLKNPLTLKSFMQLVMPLYCGYDGMNAMLAIRNGWDHNGFKYPAHKDGDKFYWQLVSNAIINNINYAELIVHMPAQDELLAIKMLAEGNPSMYWMNYAEESSIPYLPTDCPIKPLNIIRFKVPQADKDLLTELVKKAGTLLIPRYATEKKEAA